MAPLRVTPTQLAQLGARYAPSFPPALLLELAKAESNLNPVLFHPRSQAAGVLQVTPVVAYDHAARFGASPGVSVTKRKLSSGRTLYRYADWSGLRAPELNVRIAGELLERIARAVAVALGLPAPDWQRAEYAELVLFAWNAGYSAAAGVLRAMRELAAQGIAPTLSAVFQLATVDRRIAKTLADPAKVSWVRGIVGRWRGASPGQTAPASPGQTATATATGGLLAWAFFAILLTQR